MSSKSPRSKLLKLNPSKGELPPLQLKRKNNEQEKEIISMIKKNLLYDKPKKAEISLKSKLAQSTDLKLNGGAVKALNPYENDPKTLD